MNLRPLYLDRQHLGQLENMGSLCGISEREGSVIVNFFAHQPALNYGFYKKTQGWQQDPDDPGPKARLQRWKMSCGSGSAWAVTVSAWIWQVLW